MSDKKNKSYKNSQEYIKLQSEIARLNTKLQDLYEKKTKIRLYDEKISKINKLYLLILISFEIFSVIITRGALLFIQSFVVVGLSFVGFDASRKVYIEEKKIKVENPEIDTEIENTEAELKKAKGNLNEYIKRKQREESLYKGDTLDKSLNNSLNLKEDKDKSYLNDDRLFKVRMLEKKDNE